MPLAGSARRSRPNWRKRWKRWGGLPLEYVVSAVDAMRIRDDVVELETYCQFVGYPRSGKSLLRSLVGAHPEIVISDELDVLRYLQLGFRRRQVFSLILRRDRDYEVERLATGSSDYLVPRSHSGQFTRLRVIGDNKGGATIAHLRRHPRWLDRLGRRVQIPVRHLHVTRNPYDNIASIYLVSSWTDSLSAAIDFYAGLCAGVSEVKLRVPAGSMIDMRHEDLIDDPRNQLTMVCKFLGVEPGYGYLDDCASVVRAPPERTRERVSWTPQERRSVDELIASHDFLAGYSFTS